MHAICDMCHEAMHKLPCVWARGWTDIVACMQQATLQEVSYSREVKHKKGYDSESKDLCVVLAIRSDLLIVHFFFL